MTAPESYRDLYEHAPCGLLSTSANGTILRVNRTFCGWIGASADELTGHKRIQDLLTVGCKIFHQTHWMPLLQMRGSVAEVQLEILHRDGHALPMLVNAAERLVDGVMQHDMAMFIVVDRRTYERELLQARKRAEELLESERAAQAKLEEVLRAQEREAQARAVLAEQLIGIVSHDLRTPLGAVVLGATLLGTGEITTAQTRVVNRIASAATRANRLITDLLDFTQARLGGGLRVSRSEFDLHRLVAECVEELKLAWPGRMIEHHDHGDGTVSADPDRLAQVVTNLTNNALTYGTANRAVSISSIVERHSLSVEVQNHGAPIPAELMPHLFEPLRRGEQQVKLGSRSVGLGLYIVQQIACAHGGGVSVHSTQEEGTTFVVRLPSHGP
jgi:sigma-B regulation protein RsbU (phosphoserine phosphatase)